MRKLVQTWPMHLRPLMTERSLSRVIAGTIKKYAEQVFTFCEFADQQQYCTSVEGLEGRVGAFLPSVPDSICECCRGAFSPVCGQDSDLGRLEGVREESCQKVDHPRDTPRCSGFRYFDVERD